MIDKRRNPEKYSSNMNGSKETIKGEETRPRPSRLRDTLIMAAKVAQIMMDYDLRNLTPRGLVEMSKRLHEADSIGVDEYRALSFRPSNSDEALMLSETYRDMMDNRNVSRDMIIQWQTVCNELEISCYDPPALKLGRKVLELLYAFSEEEY